MMKPKLIALLLLGCVANALAATPDLAFPGGTLDTWHGFKRHRFKIDGCAAWVVEPKTARAGPPWSWCNSS